MKNKKVNPKKKLVTEYDLRRAQKDACRYAFALILSALRKSEKFGKKRMTRVYEEANRISDEITKRHLKLDDLFIELEKAGVVISDGERKEE